MKLQFFILLICTAFCFKSVQFESGGDLICQFNTDHILERQAGVPRSLEKMVYFKKPFSDVPQVAAFPSVLDWQNQLPAGFIVSVTTVDTKGFKVRLTAVSPRQFYTFHFRWLATYDPNIQIHNFETTNLGALRSGQGERKISLTLPINFPKVANGIIFLTGVKHVFTNPIVEVKIEKLSPKEVVVMARTYWLARLEMIRVCLILGTEQSLWVSEPYNFYQAPGGSHPFVRRSPGVAKIDQNLIPPKIWQTGQRVGIVSIRGYDNERTRNFRLNMDQKSLEGTLQYSITTWWDTLMYGVFHQGAIYSPDTDFKIYDEKCAELFSECDYKGDSISVCDRISDLSGIGWAKPIKSITVPAMRKVILFNQDDFQGKSISYSENQKCLSDIQFTFVQLKSHEEVVVEIQDDQSRIFHF